MKPIQYVFLWIGEAFLFAIALVTLFIIFPEDKVYWLFSKRLGFIEEYTWNNYYFMTLCLTSLLIVSIIVYVTALIRKR